MEQDQYLRRADGSIYGVKPKADPATALASCPNHHINAMDNNWCRTCDTGECPDCQQPTFYHEESGWYRHIDAAAPGCFLIPSHASE